MKPVAVEELREYVERIERLEAEKAGITDGIRTVKMEAKSKGFDVKALNFVLSMRKKARDERSVMKLYAEGLGEF